MALRRCGESRRGVGWGWGGARSDRHTPRETGMGFGTSEWEGPGAFPAALLLVRTSGGAFGPAPAGPREFACSWKSRMATTIAPSPSASAERSRVTGERGASIPRASGESSVAVLEELEETTSKIQSRLQTGETVKRKQISSIWAKPALFSSFFFFFFLNKLRKNEMYPPQFQAGTETKQKLRCHVIIFFFLPILFLLCPGGNLKSCRAGTFARTRELQGPVPQHPQPQSTCGAQPGSCPCHIRLNQPLHRASPISSTGTCSCG